MKKIILFILFLTLLISCASLKKYRKPAASIEEFEIKSVSTSDITLMFDMEITNPYPIELKLDEVLLNFYIEGKQFFKTSTARGFRIKSRGTESTVFDVNLKYSDIARIVKDYSKKEYLNCDVDVAIKLPLPGF